MSYYLNGIREAPKMTSEIQERIRVHHYTLFVDEAGDDKVDRLKPYHINGNSEWLCIGGYLVRVEQESDLERRRDEILTSFGGQAGGTLHYKKLKSANRISTAKRLAKRDCPARGFVICSYKKTMIGYENPRAAAVATGNPRDVLYNFVSRLLLERVTTYVTKSARRHAIKEPILRVVMASRRGHHFGRFKAYVEQLKNQAVAGTTYLDARQIDPTVLSRDQILRLPASKSPGLQLADTLVSAFFQSIEQASPNFSDQPALYLKPLMAEREKRFRGQRRYNNEGVTLYPAKGAIHSLTARQCGFFEAFGYDAEWLKSRPREKRGQQFSQSQRMWSNEYREE